MPDLVDHIPVFLMFAVLFVVFGTRRPRRAEGELGLDQPGLKALLRSMQTGRVTGTFHMTAGDRTGSLYFLSGHLFHATSGTLRGEPAIQECLTWQDFRYTFDKSAQLPTEETIQRPLDEILA